MGAKVVTYLGPLTQWYCGDGGALQTNIPGVCSQCPGRTGFAPAHGVCAFPVNTAQAPGCSAGELSKVGSGLRALPRSKPFRFRFRFSGAPQRHRLSRTCVLCPSHVRAAQATRCLATPRCVVSYHLPHPSRLICWVAAGLPVSGGPCVSSGELISGCDHPSGCQLPRRSLV